MSSRARCRPWFRSAEDAYARWYAEASVWLQHPALDAAMQDKVLGAVWDTLVCPFDPRDLGGIGMFHCHLCGQMVVAGSEHPDYRLAAEA